MQIYPTDLTDSQWAKIEKLFDNRKRKHSLKEIVNALLVERTFGWSNFNRRFAKDYELNTEFGTAFAHLAMCRIMLNRIRKKKYKQPLTVFFSPTHKPPLSG